MPKSRIPSPARSQGAPTTPRRYNPRVSRSVGSPARSTTSCKLTTVIQNFKETNNSFVLSPLPSRRSLLTDTTDIGEPRRKSWWKKLGENSRDVMEVLEDNDAVVNNVVEELDVEVLSQEQKNYTLDLPDSSDSESISSIVIPQRKLFTQTHNQPQNKYGQLIGRRESMAKLQRTNIENEKTINPGPKALFGQSNKLRSKPIFPAELLKISPNKTANKTKEIVATEVQGPTRTLFGNRPAMKRKNMFTDFIVSESEDEISEIQPRVFGFQKKAKQDEGKMPLAYASSASHEPREPSPTNSRLLDISGDWKLLPSSTMVQEMEVEDDSGDNLGNLAYSDDEPNDNTIEENVNIQNSRNMSQSNNTSNKRELDENQLHSSNKAEKQNKTRKEGQDEEGNNQEVTEKENDNEKITNECGEIFLESQDDGRKKQDEIDEEASKLEVMKESIYENMDIQNKSGKIFGKSQEIENEVQNKFDYVTAPEQTNEIEEQINQEIQHKSKQIHNISQKSNKGHDESYHEDVPDLDEIMEDRNEEQNEKGDILDDEVGDQELADENEEKYNENQEIQHKSKQMHNVTQKGNKELNEDEIGHEKGQNLDENVEEELTDKNEKLQNRTGKLLDKSHGADNEEQYEDDCVLNDEIENEEGETKNIQNKSENDLKVGQRRDNEEQYKDPGFAKNMEELENKSQDIQNKNKINLSKSHERENEEQNKDPGLDEDMEKLVNKNQDIQNKNLGKGRETENDAQNKNDHEQASNLADEIEKQVNQESLQKVHNLSQNSNKQEQEGSKLEENIEGPEDKNQDIPNTSREMLDGSHRTESEEQCKENHVLDNEIEDQEDENQDIQDKSEEDLKGSQESESEEQEEDDADMEELEDECEDIHNKSEKDHDKSQETEDEEQSEADHKEASKVDDEMDEQEGNSQETEHTDQEVNISQESQNEEQVDEELDKSEETEKEDQSDAENDVQSDAGHEEDPGQDIEDSENETPDIQNEIDEDDEVDEEDNSQEIVNESQENISESEEVQNESDDDEKGDDNETDDISNTEQKSSNHSQDKNKDKSRVKSPEAILHDVSNQMDSFTARGRNTSIRKTKSMIKDLNIRPSLAPPRESTGFSDGTKNSSAEGSGWDSHRITKKTLRQTFGKDFTPRKSLRTLVMEKSTKLHTAFNNDNDTIDIPRANSTEYPDATNRYDDIENERNAHEISKRARQTTLDMYLQKIKKDNMEKRKKMEEAIRNSLRTPTSDTLNLFKMPARPNFVKRPNNKTAQKPKTKETKSTIPLDLPEELLEDMKYKPPKRFKPSNAGWVTKRLYKYLETKLESKYDYKARIRAEKLVETIYNFTKDIRRHQVAPTSAVEVLKHEMARLGIVTTHHEFYGFIHEFMPREVRVKVVPDIVNKIPLPRLGPFSNILRDVQG